MKLKIYKHSSVKENIDDDIAKINPYFSSDFVKQFIPDGIVFQIDVEKTNIPKQDFLTKLAIPLSGKYDFVLYVYERGVFASNFWGLTERATSNLWKIDMVVDKPSDDIDYTWKCMVHELLHALTYKILAERNIPYTDEWNLLDLSIPTRYYMNNDPYFVKGNYWQQLNKLSQFFLKPEATLTRNTDDGVQTLGTLTCGSFNCKTLERPYMYNKPNMSCIPKGRYLCKYTFSPRFLKYTYELQNVPNRSGIRIHSANYFFELQGCIALGDSYSDINKDGKMDILNSRKTVNNLENYLTNKDFYLKIE